MKKFEKVTSPEEYDFYSIERDYKGEKQIHVFGFTYFGDHWISAESCWFIEPLSEFVEHVKENENYVNEMYGEFKQYQYDLSEEEATDCINKYFDGKCADYILPFTEITMETPCGNYVC